MAQRVDLGRPGVRVVGPAGAGVALGAVAALADHAVGVGAAVRERRVDVVAGVFARERRVGLARRAARAVAALGLLGALGHAQLVEGFGVLLLVPLLALGVVVLDVDVRLVPFVQVRVALVVVGDGRKVDRALQRAVVEAVARVGGALGCLHIQLLVVARIAVDVGDVRDGVAVAQQGERAAVAVDAGVGRRAHALRRDVLLTGGRAVGVEVVLGRVVLAARHLDRGAPFHARAVVVLGKVGRRGRQDRAIVVGVAAAQHTGMRHGRAHQEQRKGKRRCLCSVWVV